MRLLILFSSIFLFSCQKIPEDNIYTPPNTIKELKNIIYLNVDIDKALQKIPSIINQNYSQDQNLFEFKIKVKPENISKFIDCGSMNDEIYVNYINRIFDSSLEIKTLTELSAERDSYTKIEIISHYIFSSIETGAHLMLMPKDPSSLDGQSTDYTTGAPYVMFKGTPYVHLMIPMTGYYDYQPTAAPK